ncbi:MAG: hypothetical protein J3R72DRAFT_207333 [Linnemannia gamsii]|nr:MAG: hypothetical protein J3R72DRAFT_207333 [Linnemannia gamsii]
MDIGYTLRHSDRLLLSCSSDFLDRPPFFFEVIVCERESACERKRESEKKRDSWPRGSQKGASQLLTPRIDSLLVVFVTEEWNRDGYCSKLRCWFVGSLVRCTFPFFFLFFLALCCNYASFLFFTIFCIRHVVIFIYTHIHTHTYALHQLSAVQSWLACRTNLCIILAFCYHYHHHCRCRCLCRCR